MQSVRSNLLLIFHQYDDIQELFFQGDVSSFDINARDSHGKTLLHHACEYGLNKGVSILLANDAHVDVCDKKGYTPLHCACRNNEINYDICKVLLQVDPSVLLESSGVSTIVSARCKHYNRTILHYACIHGDVDVGVSLLTAGADPCVQDMYGNNPMHYACRYDHLKSVVYFIASSQNPMEFLQVSNNFGCTPFSMKTSSGGTILHIACDQGDIDAVKILLKADANPNATDIFGFTPLMRAVVSTSKSGITTDVVSVIITALCNSKCSVNAAFVPSKPSDSNVHYCEGSTALHMAIDEWADNQLCVIQALVDNGAALDVRDVHGRTPLHIACLVGCQYLIESLNPNQISFLNIKDDNGCTPLYYACKNSHLECIQAFIDQCSDIASDLMKIANNDGTTPLSVRTGSGGTILHVSCDKGDINLVKKLLEAGADPNVTDKFGFTPLMRAVVSTSKFNLVINTDVVSSIITALCNSKCNVNASFIPSKPSDSNVHYCEGSTALHMAIDEWTDNHLCVVQALVDNSAALDIRDVHGRTPLHIACLVGCQYLIGLLNPHQISFLNIKDNNGRTPLYYACKYSKIECIQAFIDYCPDNIPSLHAACDKGDINLVNKLLEAGADPNVTDEFGFTPLMKAVVSTSKSGITTDVVSSIITALCNSKCSVNAAFVPSKPFDSNVHYSEGSTALHMAIDEWTDNQLCVIQALVDNGAALDTRDVHGRTPLHIACLVGCQYFIGSLNLNQISFLNIKDNNGCTPLYYACKNSHLECIQAFIDQCPDIISDSMKIANNDGTTPLSVRTGSGGTILHAACDKGDFSIVKEVLEAGADPNITDKLGCTFLHYACKNFHLECVREFIDQISDVDSDMLKVANKYGTTPLSVQGDNGQTILHIACKKGDLSAVKKFLEAGADPNSPDGNTFTPLMLAVQHVHDIRAANIVGIFCKFKCNLNIQTLPFARSVTALHLACELGKEKCVEILVAKGANLLVRTKLYGLTPLHLACENGYHTFISSLITEESLQALTYNKQEQLTPLHIACKYHHIECVRRIVIGFSKLLLQIPKKYPSIPPFHSKKDLNGRTILHHACLRNDVQFVENLLNLGADPNVQDNNGATPLMSALQRHGNGTDMNLLSLVLSLDWKPDIKDNIGRTVLHYSAKCDNILIPLMFLSAGCDVTAVDNDGRTFSDLISEESLQLINKQLLRIDRRQIICVVGYPKCGKTTIIAAFQQAQKNVNSGIFQRFITKKFNIRVTLDNSRTAGIDTKVITTKTLGSLIFFDFAGQSEYYVSHLAFLESALSAKGSTITFIMMVDLRCSEEDRIAQCKEWLFPIKSILKDHNMLNVILIGSHLDQVGSVSISTSSLQDTLRELKRTLGTPQMQFIDCWGMDCRRLSSKGMTNLQHCLQSTHPVHSTSAEASQVPLGACSLFDRLKNSENPPLAMTPSKIIDKLIKDERPPFPLTVKYIDSYCQDLAASGLVLYIPNREDAGESWLILEMEEILSRIHGKLFAPDSAEFPMHHKNLANQFGLVHVEELNVAFKDSPLHPEMVQKLLTAMEFCHPVDSSLITEGILDGFFSRVSSDLHENLLFFPSLVKANEVSVVLSTESDIPGDDCHWVCWELSTVKPHFLHPRFQQAVFIRLACKYVQKHKSDLSTVEEHSCTISKNAMSWSTIHGVDVCIQIMHKSAIKVVARSRPGVKVSSLMEMFSSVVSDVLTVRANHAPGVDAYSVFRVMEKGTPREHTVPVSSIIDVVQAGGMYINSRERPPKLVSLKDLFLDWEISVTLLKNMLSISKFNHDVQTTTKDVSENTHSGPVMITEHYYESELHVSFIYQLGFISLSISESILIGLGLELFQFSLEIEVVDGSS